MDSRDDHIPVLTNQVITFLDPGPGKIFIDCTLGLGGHTIYLLEAIKGSGAVYGIDTDSRNLDIARQALQKYPNFHAIHDNFENLAEHGKRILEKEKRLDGILFDLGISSLHIDKAERGFSFQEDGPLDMRFDTSQGLTAADIVNTYSQGDLLNIFRAYGQEKYSFRIAKAITEHRKQHKFETTSQLADAIQATVSQDKYNYHRIHPATRVFQALRIATNRELEVLEKGLRAAIEMISPRGRIVAISFHSLEDRIVKNIFRDAKKNGILRILTKKPIRPDEEEIKRNRRSRSALLRAAEKI